MKYYCVISHTHWDREWYMPLEAFRLKLVDLMDRCLATLEKYDDYIFHLDAQTIVLEDYLEIRPSKKAILSKYISEGRLVVGPWYLQNDFYLTSGEATVRNLIEGHKIATEYGKCSKVGYAPDQFGNISQLPQILKGFGIDNFIFGRGYSEFEKNEVGEVIRKPSNSEFIWQGADGTQAIAMHMKYWYNNAQRFSEDIEKSELLLKQIETQFEDVALTPYLLLMNGVDHLEAQDNLLPILNELDKQESISVKQWDLFDYVQAIKSFVNENNIDLAIHKGELRTGTDWDILKGTLSSRSYLKISNVKLQNMLEQNLEPLYSFLELSGFKDSYSLDHFRYMWKQLMKNHPHDSICGCSRDEVHSHMEDNFKRLEEMTTDMQERGLKLIARHMDLKNYQDGNFVIIVLNTTQSTRNGVVEAIVDIPLSSNIEEFELLDGQGNKVEFDIISKTRTRKDVFSPINLPGWMDIDRYKLYIFMNETKPTSVRGFILRACENGKMKKPLALDVSKVVNNGTIENEFLKLEINNDGTVDITKKAENKKILNAIDIEETVDFGSSYIYNSSDKHKKYYGSKFVSEIKSLKNNAYSQSISITYKMLVPAFFDFDKKERSTELKECIIELIYTLNKGDKFIKVDFKVDNKACDHRIRVVVDTNIKTENSIADIPFDIVSHKDEDHYVDTLSKVLPNTSFALLEDNDLKEGVAVFSQGLHEYEHIEESKLAFTLVRSTGEISRDLDLLPGGGEQWHCPDNQCLRIICGSIGIMPYNGQYLSAEIPQYSRIFSSPLITYFTSCDYKTFDSGRPCVQDTRILEFFYLDDPYKNNKVKDDSSFIEIVGCGIVVSAIKKAEDESGIIVRLVNLNSDDVKAKIKVNGKIILCNLDESVINHLGNNSIDYKFRGKEILTLKVE